MEEGTAILHLPNRDSVPRLVVRVHIPSEYPMGPDPPWVELQVGVYAWKADMGTDLEALLSYD